MVPWTFTTLKTKFYLLSLIYIEEELAIAFGKNASYNLLEQQHLHLSSLSGIILVPWTFTTLKTQFYLLSLIYIEEELGIVIGKNRSSNLFVQQYLHLSSVSGIILVPWAFTTL